MNFLKRSWPVLLILSLLALAFYFNLPNYLSWSTFQTYHDQIKTWSDSHFALSVFLYMTIYALSVAISIPGAVILTLIGGFLFGPILGTLIVVVSATLGAILVFLAVKYFIGEWASKHAHGWIKKMQAGFAKNALSYLLILRLIPLFPFWVVNIVPAILNVDGKLFALATLVGIIPGTFVYVSLGNGVNHLFEIGQKPDFSVIFTLPILLPLFGLAVLSLLPILYQRLRRKEGNEPKRKI
ncbi:TVP38/TMEM64 family protein [Legionella sp. W05-934-2]|jgi:uncharacterized membrane protein YdjX (TVP38/TMEM64 family)|uniref:TVP38/TMEM64 family protein n=1 Tax=Legionella sp. W05-934-2 TaxID=1198649 RepID=UPI003461C04C